MYLYCLSNPNDSIAIWIIGFLFMSMNGLGGYSLPNLLPAPAIGMIIFNLMFALLMVNGYSSISYISMVGGFDVFCNCVGDVCL